MSHDTNLNAQPASPCSTRLATEADIPSLLGLINSAYAIETFLDGRRTDEKCLADDLQRGEILVGEDGQGRILACIYLEIKEGRGYLGQFAVAPICQRRGLGRWIFSAAEERLRSQGCRAVDLYVLNRRSELPPVYRNFGYTESGTKEFHGSREVLFGPECHCIVMSKQL